MEFIKKIVQQIVDKLFCCHSWAQYRTVRVTSDWYGEYTIYHFYCTKCGKFKKIKSS